MPCGILIVDKPADWTSHDVVAKLRGLLRERRIGHGGTLDPLATGVLPILVGRATRAAGFITGSDKEYLAELRLGVITDTQDVTGRVLERRAAHVTPAALEEALERFRGEIQQIPPLYSAIRQNGKKLYEIARAGGTAERPPRAVTIFSLQSLEQVGEETYRLAVRCSKGTYIRTLCHDIGQVLGCGGMMTALRRTRVGNFQLGQAVTLEEVAAAAGQGLVHTLLRPVDTCFLHHPAMDLDRDQEFACRNGALFAAAGAPGDYRVYSGESGEFLMLGRLTQGKMKTVKSFWALPAPDARTETKTRFEGADF